MIFLLLGHFSGLAVAHGIAFKVPIPAAEMHMQHHRPFARACVIYGGAGCFIHLKKSSPSQEKYGRPNPAALSFCVPAQA